MPPINASWTEAFLSGAKIPDLALRPGGGSNDWSSDYKTCISSSHWAVSYDDGPGPFTQAVIDKLDSIGKKGTFFFIGSYILENQQILRNAYNSGHQICGHTWSHKLLTSLTNDEIVAEVVWTAQLIYDIIGVAPTCIRPPFGDIDERVRAVLNAMGMDVIIWNRDSNDWVLGSTDPKDFFGDKAETAIPAKFASWVSQEPMAGSISLQHGIFFSLGGIAPSLDVLNQSRYSLVNISECIGKTAYSNKLLLKASLLLDVSDAAKS